MQDRIFKYDTAKAILIFLVVLGHFSDAFLQYPFSKSIFMAIYSFHMPAFFFISGLFNKKLVKKEWKDVMLTVGGILMLCLVCNFIRFISIFAYDTDTSFHIFRLSNVSWFLFVWAACIVFTYAVRNLKPLYVFSMAIVIALITGYDDSLGALFAVYRITVFFPFFYAGYLCETKDIDYLTDNKVVKIISGIAIVVLLFVCYKFPEQVFQLKKLVSGANSYYQMPYKVTAFSWSFRFIYYLAVYFLVFAFISLMPKRKIPVISAIGKRTLGIYVFHLPIVEILKHQASFKRLFDGSNIKMLIVFCVVSGLIVLVLSLRPFSAFTDLFIKHNKRPDS